MYGPKDFKEMIVTMVLYQLGVIGIAITLPWYVTQYILHQMIKIGRLQADSSLNILETES